MFSRLNQSKTLPSAFVTYGWCRSSYTVVKSLANRGVRVHVADSSPLAMSRWSRFSDQFWRLPDFYAEPENYVAELGIALARSGAKVLLPCFEDIELVIRHRDMLPEETLVALPSHADWAVAEDKYEYVKILEQTDCPVPRTLRIDSKDELSDAASELSFPLLVKIRSGNGSRGVSIVRERSSLESTFFDIVEQFQLDHHRWPVLQQHLGGNKFKQEGIFCHGRSLASVVYQILRCKGPDRFGTSTFRQTVDHPQLSNYAVDALATFNWNGVYNTDWICDAQGVPHLIDINGRLSGALAICYAAGVDIPWMWYCMALGATPDEVHARSGVKARWVLGDMIGMIQHLRAGAFRQSLSILKPEFCYLDDFSLSDPFPLMGEALDYFYKFVQSRGSFTPTTKGMVR